MKTLADVLAERVLAAKQATVAGSAVFASAAQHFLDTLASVLVGFKVGTYKALLNCLQDGRGQVPVPGSDLRLSAGDAAAVVAYQINSSVIEGGSRQGATHPAAAVVPVLWALGRDMDLARLYPAMTAGYEAMIRLAALGNPRLALRGFHPTGLTAPLGAAVAAAVLLDMDQEQLSRALRLAVAGSCGLMRAFKEETTQPLHVAHATRAGLIAALLAQKGAEADPAMLESGFIPAYMGDGVALGQDVFAGPGHRWAIQDAYLKLYPGCRHVHPALDAWTRLMETQDLDYRQVESAKIATYKVAVETEIHEVKSRGDAYFNGAYALALKAVLGRADWDAFDTAHLNDPTVQDFARRVQVVLDEEIEKTYPRLRSARLTLKLKDGRTLSIFQELAKGEPETPFSMEETAQKFRGEAEKYLSAQAMESIVSKVSQGRGRAQDVFQFLPDHVREGKADG